MQMLPIDRRKLLLGGITSSVLCPSQAASGSEVDDTLRSSIARRKIPAVVAMAASANKILYRGAFGQRDSSGVPVGVDSIFRIASMTKAITTVAALQLVEQGKVGLDEPVAQHLPQFRDIAVLQGFDANGRASLRPARTAPALRHLLTHTSGFCYDNWDGDMFRYASQNPVGDPAQAGPLMFEPGTRWQYGQGLDWTGRLVEAISGLTLEEYFQGKILQPLGMRDTSYIVQPAKFERLVSNHHRNEQGFLEEDERKLPALPKSYNGGGGLYSTAADYVRFTQMILNHGVGANGTRVLQAKTVSSMEVNQIGPLAAGKMKSFKPNVSSDVDMQPGHTEKWGLGFLINTTAYTGGRSAGSLAWAGLYNTFYWIDPKRNVCAVILMQFLPFVDKEAIGMLDEFERSVYRSVVG
ncbi:MAG TPA: serine hydrolase domain-containing protein [Bryobacteraceae bacterium]|nr:serine hydrolase domain-containing protein [Bryobacteraceae bacterium]